jgi:hypothetical protein
VKTESTPPAERAHSELGASVAARFFACPGSVLRGRGMPNRSSVYAQAGTAAHAVGELCLRNGQDAIEYVDRTVEGVVIDETTADNVQVYVDVCRETMSTAAAYGIEQRFDLARFDPPVPMFGTADFWSLNAGPSGRVLRIVDYKNGWLPVQATNNPQLRYYALGAMFLFSDPVDQVEAIIVQRDMVKRTTFDPLELVEWSVELMQKARETQRPDAPTAAGAWCRFCPVSGQCPTQAEAALAVAGMEFGALEIESAPPTPATLSPERLAAVLARASEIRTWLDAVEAAAQAAISRGDRVPGFKLVPTRAVQGWRDPENARGLLDALFEIDPLSTPELLSPAQARSRIVTARYNAARDAGQKRPKKTIEAEVREQMGNLVSYVSNGLKLVPESDTRIGMPDAGSEFPETWLE